MSIFNETQPFATLLKAGALALSLITLSAGVLAPSAAYATAGEGSSGGGAGGSEGGSGGGGADSGAGEVSTTGFTASIAQGFLSPFAVQPRADQCRPTKKNKCN